MFVANQHTYVLHYTANPDLQETTTHSNNSAPPTLNNSGLPHNLENLSLINSAQDPPPPPRTSFNPLLNLCQLAPCIVSLPLHRSI